jgi:hypothetical protein
LRDYGDLLDETVSRGQLSTSGWVVGGYNPITLNSTGWSEISKTGTTKFGLRSSRDISASVPSGAEVVWFSSSEGGHAAKLEVTYSVPVPPTVTTNAASNVTGNSALLNGYLNNDGGEACWYRFQWGTTTSYGNNTTWTGSITSGQSFSQSISGLSPGTTYHFRAQCQNSAGTGSGGDQVFTTVHVPIVYNVCALNVTQTTATLKGWLADDGGGACKYRFEWGLTQEYGNATSWIGSITSGSYFYADLSGLTPDTTYHFRPQCWNSAGTGSGGDLPFTTLPVDDDSFPPEVGVEWVNDYPGSGNDLSLSDDSTADLAAWLQARGWSLEFNNPPDGHDGDAWEKHFKDSVNYGGWDYLYADAVDLVMFCGHGDAGELIFGASSQDDEYLQGYEAEWGDWDLDWVILEACEALFYDDGVPLDKFDGCFAQALNGTRLICGAATGMWGPVGDGVGWYLFNGWSLTDAWFQGAGEVQVAMQQSCTLRVIAEDLAYFGEQVWWCGTTIVTDPVVDSDYYCMDLIITFE